MPNTDDNLLLLYASRALIAAAIVGCIALGWQYFHSQSKPVMEEELFTALSRQKGRIESQCDTSAIGIYAMEEFFSNVKSFRLKSEHKSLLDSPCDKLQEILSRKE